MYQSIITEVDDGIGILTLNRPDRHNPLDATLIAEATQALGELAADPGVRAVVLSSSGRSFCAGIDPAWMREALNGTPEDNQQGNRHLARLLSTLNELPKPTLARVQGPATTRSRPPGRQRTRPTPRNAPGSPTAATPPTACGSPSAQATFSSGVLCEVGSALSTALASGLRLRISSRRAPA